MSRLLGPLSETISSVSARPCARAGDQSAGADTVPAATAVMDLRKSRRFMPSPLLSVLIELCRGLRKAHANRAESQSLGIASGSQIAQNPHGGGPARLHTNGHFCRKFRRYEPGQKTTGRREAGPSLPSPIALFGRDRSGVSDRGLRKRGSWEAAQP